MQWEPETISKEEECQTHFFLQFRRLQRPDKEQRGSIRLQ